MLFLHFYFSFYFAIAFLCLWVLVPPAPTALFTTTTHTHTHTFLLPPCPLPHLHTHTTTPTLPTLSLPGSEEESDTACHLIWIWRRRKEDTISGGSLCVPVPQWESLRTFCLVCLCQCLHVCTCRTITLSVRYGWMGLPAHLAACLPGRERGPARLGMPVPVSVSSPTSISL